VSKIHTGGTETNPDIAKQEKAKVAIVNSVGAILTLRRSNTEDTRQGEWDWPGGKFEEGETAISQVLDREVTLEELPKTVLRDVMPFHIKAKIISTGFKVSYLLIARATFPAEGVILGDGDKPEHDDYQWVMPEDYVDLNIPNKYKEAVANGGDKIGQIVLLHAMEATTVNLGQKKAA
jgi:8-oxo-dGTP pyrophosphatase MutT (NUDIX family)